MEVVQSLSALAAPVYLNVTSAVKISQKGIFVIFNMSMTSYHSADSTHLPTTSFVICHVVTADCDPNSKKIIWVGKLEEQILLLAINGKFYVLIIQVFKRCPASS